MMTMNEHGSAAAYLAVSSAITEGHYIEPDRSVDPTPATHLSGPRDRWARTAPPRRRPPPFKGRLVSPGSTGRMTARSPDAEVRSFDLSAVRKPGGVTRFSTPPREVEYGLNGWVSTRRTAASRRLQKPMSKKVDHLLAAEAKAAEKAEAAIDPMRRCPIT
jgi:hypothetical protein